MSEVTEQDDEHNKVQKELSENNESQHSQPQLAYDNSQISSLVMPMENGNCDKQITNQDTNQKLSQGKSNHDSRRIGGKRVRFSVCEYITETLVQENVVDGSHSNPAFENGESKEDGSAKMESTGGSKLRYIGGRLRRDSVHPLVPFHSQNDNDNWDVALPPDKDDDNDISWSDLSTKEKILRVAVGVGKLIGLLGLLYFFVCSLDLLSLGFRLVGGSAAGEVFRRSSILQNPVVGVMLGILTTVLVQSSSTSTSILVGMVAAGFLDVRLAIPPIMGANIGTSITNTIVSFTQAGDREQFRRAFAGATILDMFNWLTVIVLLPIEVLFGYLYHVSKATVDLIIPDSSTSGGEIQLLSVITNPFVDLIVQLNDTVMECWATPNCTDADDASLVKEYCSTTRTEIFVEEIVIDNSGKELFNFRDVAVQDDLQKCDFLFAGTSLNDVAIGAIILVSALLVLCLCLVMIVKLLNSVLKGHVANIIKHTLNSNIPYVPWLTGYIAILIGAFMTFLVQSSSVFTSALTPLVGLGVISLNRVYPLTLGANIGTTTTAILASMAAEGNALQPSLQIALCHFYFNITGVILFYPAPFLRLPIKMAQVLGNTTAKYRWFAIFYLIFMFAILPILFILLSLAGSIYVIALVVIIGAVAIVVAIITLLQRKLPHLLPEWLRDWKWLPLPMRSLKPYDKLVSKLPCCRGKVSEEYDNSDDEYSYLGKSHSNRDFVYLAGNKIPPPIGFDQGKQNPARTIIVPTRVIRNIGNGNYSQNDEASIPVTKNGIATNSSQLPPPPPLENEHSATGNAENFNKNPIHAATLSNNTLPIPAALEKSLSQSRLQQNGQNEGTNRAFNADLEDPVVEAVVYSSDEMEFIV